MLSHQWKTTTGRTRKNKKKNEGLSREDREFMEMVSRKLGKVRRSDICSRNSRSETNNKTGH